MVALSAIGTVDIEVVARGRAPRAELRYAVLEPFVCQAEVLSTVRPPFVMLASGARVPTSDALESNLSVVFGLRPCDDGFESSYRWARPSPDGSPRTDIGPMRYSSLGLRLRPATEAVEQAPQDFWHTMARSTVEAHLQVGFLAWPEVAVGPGARWRVCRRETEGTTRMVIDLLAVGQGRCLVRVACRVTPARGGALAERSRSTKPEVEAIVEIDLARPLPFGLARGASVHTELVPPDGYRLLSSEHRASLPDRLQDPRLAAAAPSVLRARLGPGQVQVTASPAALRRQRRAWSAAQRKLRSLVIEAPHTFDFDRLAEIRPAARTLIPELKAGTEYGRPFIVDRNVSNCRLLVALGDVEGYDLLARMLYGWVGRRSALRAMTDSWREVDPDAWLPRFQPDLRLTAVLTRPPVLDRMRALLCDPDPDVRETAIHVASFHQLPIPSAVLTQLAREAHPSWAEVLAGWMCKRGEPGALKFVWRTLTTKRSAGISGSVLSGLEEYGRAHGDVGRRAVLALIRRLKGRSSGSRSCKPPVSSEKARAEARQTACCCGSGNDHLDLVALALAEPSAPAPADVGARAREGYERLADDFVAMGLVSKAEAAKTVATLLVSPAAQTPPDWSRFLHATRRLFFPRAGPRSREPWYPAMLRELAEHSGSRLVPTAATQVRLARGKGFLLAFVCHRHLVEVRLPASQAGGSSALLAAANRCLALTGRPERFNRIPRLGAAVLVFSTPEAARRLRRYIWKERSAVVAAPG